MDEQRPARSNAGALHDNTARFRLDFHPERFADHVFSSPASPAGANQEKHLALRTSHEEAVGRIFGHSNG
jgi:hypothetical protein